MSDRAVAIDAAETVPIRYAAGSTGRSYNTTTTNDNPSTDRRKPTSAIVTTNANASPVVEERPMPPSVQGNQRNDAGQNTQRKRRTNWVKDFADRYGSISLENKGSVARDHLALERTFLAWLRTSLAFASIGIAITQLFRLNTSLPHRAAVTTATYPASTNQLPFSPLVGHAISAEMAPYLQEVLASNNPSSPPTLGPTLFDQLFSLSADGQRVPSDFTSQQLLAQSHSETKIKHLGKPLGATFIGISILILLVGFHRYFESQYWIIKGKFPASRGSVGFVGLVTGALIVACLIVIVVVDPTSYTRTKV